ncbi:hypothetical protein B9Z55_016611 [Caenorhabditis nigoni]|uniref:DUF281 domain-containing protein n=1 Tax=Caenorhabditis nigoni TaxID=1611254 RepID=A0A2G5T5E8_9PELO|nr:hypothetical protein B9Z55_016611 [Caenorhabditis nigoni]
MNLIFNTLLITGLIACCQAACNTCACTGHPDLFTEEMVAGFDQTVLNFTFIEVKNVNIVDCQLVLECDFQGKEWDGGAKIDYFPDYEGVNHQATGLSDLVCVGGSTWQAKETVNETPRFTEVKYIGCYGATISLEW